MLTACGADGWCFTRNDNGRKPFQGKVQVDVLRFFSGDKVRLGETINGVALGGEGGELKRFCLGAATTTGSIASGTPTECEELRSVLVSAGYESCFGTAGSVSCALELLSTDDTNPATGETLNLLLLGSPERQLLPSANISTSVTVGDESEGKITLTVESSAIALFVVLYTQANGRFSENAFTLMPRTPRTLEFIPTRLSEGADTTLATLKRTLRVEHLAQNLVRSRFKADDLQPTAFALSPPPPPGTCQWCGHCCGATPTVLPPWPATWAMNESTVVMPCNGTGLIDPARARDLRSFSLLKLTL